MSGGSTSPASAEAAATNSRASLPGVGEGLAPGYPAAAARPFFSSPKVEETLTASCRSYGGGVGVWGDARASGPGPPPAETGKNRPQNPTPGVPFWGNKAPPPPPRVGEEDLTC